MTPWKRVSKPHATIPVVKRDAIYRGPIVQMHVPTDADLVDVVVSGRSWKCARFIRPMKGGFMTCYAYGEKPTADLRNKKTVFEALVHKETIEDGRVFIALHLVEADEAATHRLSLHHTEELHERYRGTDSVRIKMLPPLTGWVVFTQHKGSTPQ